MKRVRTLFMGSDAIALPFLEAVQAKRTGGIEWVAVCTQPDRRTGRGMRIHANPIKLWAEDAGIPVWQPVRCGSPEEEKIRESGIDLVVVMAYGQLLRQSFLDIPSMGIVNLHTSLLPELRGASPIQTAMAEGFRRTGVTLMRMVRKMDAGPVGAFEELEIEDQWTSEDLREALSLATARLVSSAFPKLTDGSLNWREQEEAEATYCRILRKEDAWLDFRSPASRLASRIRGFTGWPGTRTVFKESEIRIQSAEPVPEGGGQPGEVLKGGPGQLHIACGQGSLRVHRLQRAGGKSLDSADFLRGFPILPGDRFESRPVDPLISPKPFRMNLSARIGN